MRSIIHLIIVIPKLGRLKLDHIEKPVVLNIIDNLIKTDRGVTLIGYYRF